MTTTPTGTEAGFDLDKLEAELKSILRNLDRDYIGSVRESVDEIGEMIALARRVAPATTDSESGDALPCPFCGGKCDPDGWLGGGGLRGPECENCGATADSLAGWNRRASLAPVSAQQPDMSDAYVGAREDLAVWKKRALEAEESCRRMTAALNAENGPTFMGEPVSAQQGAAVAAGWFCETRHHDGSRTIFQVREGISGAFELYRHPAAKAPAAQAVAARWEARRWCKGDAEWTDWQPITAAEYERYKDDATFEVRASPASTPEAAPEQQLASTSNEAQGESTL
jgi:hypothetical protein